MLFPSRGCCHCRRCRCFRRRRRTTAITTTTAMPRRRSTFATPPSPSRRCRCHLRPLLPPPQDRPALLPPRAHLFSAGLVSSSPSLISRPVLPSWFPPPTPAPANSPPLMFSPTIPPDVHAKIQPDSLSLPPVTNESSSFASVQDHSHPPPWRPSTLSPSSYHILSPHPNVFLSASHSPILPHTAKFTPHPALLLPNPPAISITNSIYKSPCKFHLLPRGTQSAGRWRNECVWSSNTHNAMSKQSPKLQF